MATIESSTSEHLLCGVWTMWAHYPHDNNWTQSGYKLLMNMSTVEDVIVAMHLLPDKFIRQCMLFIMKNPVFPIWEDEHNKHGGSFSYKVPNKIALSLWKDLTYALTGNTLSTNQNVLNDINGITISPKNNFCIVKIWMKSCTYQNPSVIVDNIRGLTARGCIFKKHDCK